MPRLIEVEDLRLVDRPDRARVAGAPDVGLVDLEAGDGRPSAPSWSSSIANSPRKLSVPRALCSICDHALEVAARAVQEDALAEQVAGRVLADVARVAGQVEQLAAAAEADLDLVHARATADEDGCRCGSCGAARRRWPVPSAAARRGRRVACRLTNSERVRREVLLAGEVQAGAVAEANLGGAPPQRLARSAVSATCPTAPALRARCACAFLPRSIRVRVTRPRPGSPPLPSG